MSEIDRMIAQYVEQRPSMKEKQKAEAERRLWEAHCASLPEGERPGYRRDWFQEVLDGPAAGYEQRQMMLNAGPWVDPLWAMLDSGSAHYAVVRLFRKAKELAAKDQVPHEQAVRRVIDEYGASGHLSYSADGKVFRRLSPTEKARSVPPASISELEVDPSFDGSSSQNSRSKKFLLQLALLTDGYLKSSFGELEESDALLLKLASDEFIGFVREAAEDLKRRVNSVRSSVKTAGRRQRVSREQFRQACEVLNLPYSYGQKVDLRFCKKTMLKRAGPLHPDRNRGSHSAQVEYQAVIESYDVLEKYSEGQKHENGERSHEGR